MNRSLASVAYLAPDYDQAVAFFCGVLGFELVEDRDLGDGNGHYWATVQAIKRPTLLEFCGPLMMSYPVTNNVQYRLTQEGDETIIKFRHSGFGLIQEDHRKGVVTGWSHLHENARKRAEKA